MDVGVDEARAEDAAGIVRDRSVGGEFAPQTDIGAGGLDEPIAADDQPIRLMLEGLGRIDQERIVCEADERSSERCNGIMRQSGNPREILRAVSVLRAQRISWLLFTAFT
jgi:hypothetical protein